MWRGQGIGQARSGLCVCQVHRAVGNQLSGGQRMSLLSNGTRQRRVWLKGSGEFVKLRFNEPAFGGGSCHQAAVAPEVSCWL